MTVFRVSVILSCIPITPTAIDAFLKVLELLPLDRFAVQQQLKSKKKCHLMFSVENLLM